jgi:hypothetical protein
LAIDDLETVQSWKSRGIRIYGTAKFVERNGRFEGVIHMGVTSHTSWRWGIEPVEMAEGSPRQDKELPKEKK